MSSKSSTSSPISPSFIKSAAVGVVGCTVAYLVHRYLRLSRSSFASLCPAFLLRSSSSSPSSSSSSSPSYSAPLLSPRLSDFSSLHSICFDLDGTLVESKEIWYFLLNAAAKHFKFPSIRHEVWEPTFGQSMEKNVEVFFGNNINQHEFNVFCDDHYSDFIDHLILFKESLRILNASYKKTNGKISIVTNCPRKITEIIINHCGFFGGADSIINPENFLITCAGDNVKNDGWRPVSEKFDEGKEYTHIRPKPSADLLWYAASRLGVDANRIVMIGDSKYDMLCAKNAGAMSVGVNCEGGMANIKQIGELDQILRL